MRQDARRHSVWEDFVSEGSDSVRTDPERRAGRRGLDSDPRDVCASNRSSSSLRAVRWGRPSPHSRSAQGRGRKQSPLLCGRDAARYDARTSPGDHKIVVTMAKNFAKAARPQLHELVRLLVEHVTARDRSADPDSIEWTPPARAFLGEVRWHGAPGRARGANCQSRGEAGGLPLADGRVLLVGHGAGPQVYEPVSDSVEAAGTMVVPRYRHAAALMSDSSVVLVGGLEQRVHDPIASIQFSIRPRTASATVVR